MLRLNLLEVDMVPFAQQARGYMYTRSDLHIIIPDLQIRNKMVTTFSKQNGYRVLRKSE